MGDNALQNKPPCRMTGSNPCLGDEQQAIIASDYAMTDGKLLIEQRVPLMHYALERMQVSYNGGNVISSESAR
jgi:hypothetical protein